MEMTPEKSDRFHSFPRFACEAMRVRFEIVVADAESSPAHPRAAAAEALREIAEVESWLSAYRPDSALYALNAQAAEGPMRVDGRLFAFLQRAAHLSAATEGAFDLTVGPLLRLWGLGHGADGGNVPTDEQIAAARRCVGMADMVILDPEEMTVAFARPGVRLDPGAMGKGYALDRAAEILREAGIQNALLHGGTSSVVALGSPPEFAAGWPVLVRHPLDPEIIVADLRLRNESLGVSAVHGKSFTAPDGATYGHVIDPRTGRPTQSALLAAVVTPLRNGSGRPFHRPARFRRTGKTFRELFFGMKTGYTFEVGVSASALRSLCRRSRACLSTNAR